MVGILTKLSSTDTYPGSPDHQGVMSLIAYGTAVVFEDG